MRAVTGATRAPIASTPTAGAATAGWLVAAAAPGAAAYPEGETSRHRYTAR